jgi:cephalosporin hydroxylase
MDFFDNRLKISERNFADKKLQEVAKNWHDVSREYGYQYMFEWMGRPIIQDPQDICAIQELIWRVKPDLIVETGIAHGGSLVLSASIFAAIGMGEHLAGLTIMPRKVVGVDIDIRKHNREALENHPLSGMIRLIEGSSISRDIVKKVYQEAEGSERVLIMLDSNHTAEHVYDELVNYAPLVNAGSAILVLDTGIEFVSPDSFNVQRPWGPGNSPLTAVNQFLTSPAGKDFEKDRSIEKRTLITCAPEGLLVRMGRTQVPRHFLAS